MYSVVMQMCTDVITLYTNSGESSNDFNFFVKREYRKVSFVFSVFDSHIGGVLTIEQGKLIIKLLVKNSKDEEKFANTITCKTKKNGELTDSIKYVMKSLFLSHEVESIGEFIYKLIMDCKLAADNNVSADAVLNENTELTKEETNEHE